jgi:hypothetical protein
MVGESRAPECQGQNKDCATKQSISVSGMHHVASLAKLTREALFALHKRTE